MLQRRQTTSTLASALSLQVLSFLTSGTMHYDHAVLGYEADLATFKDIFIVALCLSCNNNALQSL